MSNRIRNSGLRRAIALVTMVLAVGCGGGATTTDETAQESTSAGGENDSMTLDEFAAELARQAAPELCGAPDAALRACFEVDDQQCTQAFTIAMTECANQLRADLPATVDDSNIDAVVGPVSECAGLAYRIGLDQHGLVLQTPECQTPAS